jgi:hypothetical protein
MTTINDNVEWNEMIEEYLCSSAEKAHSLAWLHKRCESYYSSYNTYIQLPVIILSTLNGATSIGSQSLFGDAKMASVGIGLVALLTALLSTIASFFSWSRRAEGHKIAHLSYSKLNRTIKLQMSLPRDERMVCAEIIKYTKTEVDRLSEISPLINNTAISEFKIKFDNEKYKWLNRPDECNGIEKVEPYKEVMIELTPQIHSSNSALSLSNVVSGIKEQSEEKKLNSPAEA